MTDRLRDLLAEALLEATRIAERLRQVEAQRDSLQRELAALRAAAK